MGTRLQLGRLERWVRDWWGRLSEEAGGVEGRRAIVVMALVLSLSAADGGAMGALARPLERSFRIGNTGLGLLVTVTSLLGAIGTLPMGVLVDRVQRRRLLIVVVFGWSAAMIACGLAPTYLFLLCARLALGLVTAAAGPAVASLTGDLFPSARRSRMYGWILSGELLGAGAGLLVAGNLGLATNWRVTFFLLAAFSAALAAAIAVWLKEPQRNAMHHLGVEGESPNGPMLPAATSATLATQDRDTVRGQGSSRSRPNRGHILRQDPAQIGLWRAGRYVLGISTNRVLIAASALGYFFVAGMRTFSVLYAETRFGLDTRTISLLVVLLGAGALAGTVAGGRLTDRLIDHGDPDARMTVSGLGLVAASLLFVPGVLSASIAVSMPFFVVGSAALTAPNPALDAARLDVVPSGLWGRAEAVRSLARNLLEAFAPLAFGVISSLIGTGRITGVGFGLESGSGPGSGSNAAPGLGLGLNYTFLVMLMPLMVSGLLLIHQRRAYLCDVATAAVSEQAGGRRGARRSGIKCLLNESGTGRDSGS
jgi:predicted MFS family arabinose efflux permease